MDEKAMPDGMKALLILTALGLAGCAARSPVALGPDADPRAARARLAEAAEAGPVRLELNAPPRTTDGALGPAEVAAQAARGIKGLTVGFAPAAEAGGAARLLLLFDPPPGLQPVLVCTAGALPEPAPAAAALRLHAVFCNDGTYLADAAGTTADRSRAGVERLIWRTTGRLFPDDYPESYGFDLFGYRIGFSGHLAL
jgi:hypothetical protein